VIWALAPDLFFSARIRETAKALGIGCEIFKNAEELGDPDGLVIVDMEVVGAPEAVRAMKRAHVVAYLHDANDAAIEAARAAGADKVLSRGGLTKKLPELLIDELRKTYAGKIGATGALAEAFAKVPRERFVEPATTLAELYDDLMAGDGERPSLHARWIAMLDLTKADSVLHVGHGTGYYTAILGELAGRVFGVEARDVEATSGTFDAIYTSQPVTPERVARLQALAPGGRMLLRLADLTLLVYAAAPARWGAQVVTPSGEPSPTCFLDLRPHAQTGTCVHHRDGFCLSRLPGGDPE
jgi:protein-L-isoaspartate O-methyltransferase